MSRLFRLLAPAALSALVIGCASGSDGSSDATTTTDEPSVSTTVGSDPAPPAATAASSPDTIPATSLSLEDLRQLDAEGIADALIADLPPSAELTVDQQDCVHDGIIELVETFGVDEFIDGVDNGLFGDPVPNALEELAQRCGFR